MAQPMKTQIGDLEYMCDGCKKADMETLSCTAYAEPPIMFALKQHCPLNTNLCKKATARRRVGQQKQKRKR